MAVVSAAPARRIAGLGLLVLTLAWAASARALPVTLVVDGGWTNFSWTGGLGPIDTPADGYQVTSASSIEIQLTDCCTIGDRYEIFVNNVSFTTTSAVAPADDGDPSGAFDGPDSWADARLSKVSFVLGAGSYDIDISVIDTAPGASEGGGFIQALSIPEPSTLALLAIGFVGLLWVTLPVCRHASARPSSAKR